jgi:hypothetical protein
VALQRGDVARLYYADHPTWRELSGPSLLVVDAAKRLRGGDPSLDEAADYMVAIRGITERIQRGESLAPIIAVGPEGGDAMVLVEGHCRATAYLVAGPPEELEVIHGSAPLEELRRWRLLPKPRT